VSNARDSFLATVRAAVAAGNQAGHSPELPAGARVGYQGAGPNPVQRFAAELKNVGGQCHIVSRAEDAIERAVAILEKTGAKKIVLDHSEVLTQLELADALRANGCEAWKEGESTATAKAVLFAADAGITGVDALIAETGSVVLAARPGQARSLSLLPPVHIAIAERRQIVPDLFDIFDGGLCSVFSPSPPHPFTPSRSCLTLITGPSKTGDIELRLVTGVHGPGELHVVLIDS
jgi:L-lactate utilization protein LutC